jgi:lysophospholipase L1-like esterase
LVVGDSQTAAPYGIGAELGTIFRSRGTYAAHIGRNGWGAWSYARSMGVLRNALAQHRPDLVIFQLGGNDAASNMGSPLKRTTYRRNIKDLVDAARASGAAVYWVGPSKAEAGSLFPSASAAADHQRKRTAVAASQRTILGELGVPWFDSMGLTAGLHTADGIHYPPGIAYRTWAGSLAAQMPSVTA